MSRKTNDSGPPKVMTWGKATPALVISVISDALRLMFVGFIFWARDGRPILHEHDERLGWVTGRIDDCGVYRRRGGTWLLWFRTCRNIRYCYGDGRGAPRVARGRRLALGEKFAHIQREHAVVRREPSVQRDAVHWSDTCDYRIRMENAQQSNQNRKSRLRQMEKENAERQRQAAQQAQLMQAKAMQQQAANDATYNQIQAANDEKYNGEETRENLRKAA